MKEQKKSKLKKDVMSYKVEVSQMDPLIGQKEITVPNEGLSIRTIFDRWRSSGQIPTGEIRNGYEQEDLDEDNADSIESTVDMEKARQLDIYDRTQLIEAAKEEQVVKKRKLDAMEKAKAEAKAKAQKELDESVEYYKRAQAEKQKQVSDDAKQPPKEA